MALSQIEGLRVYPEPLDDTRGLELVERQAPAFIPGSRWIDFSFKNVIFFAKKNFRALLLCNDRKMLNGSSPMIGNRIGHRLDSFLYALLTRICGNRGNPNLFTLLGFLASIVASALILKGFWVPAGSAILLSGFFDLLDGVVARKTGQVTVFGGFFDSVLDRYSDLLLMMALLVHYLNRGQPGMVVLCSFASLGIALVPYARARAEAARLSCTVGVMERAERMILLAIGALFHLMVPVLWILAVLTHVTVLHRIYHVWKQLHPPDRR
jgi:CDP-diacylglycerol--glycerol-3-phosphate 3-phosphatidyltransferase